MIANFNTVNFQYSGDVASMKKAMVEAKDAACDHLIIAGIYHQQIDSLVKVLKEIPPMDIKAKSIAFVVDDQEKETNGMDMMAVMKLVQLQKVFGEDLKRPCKDYYIMMTFVGNQIIAGRADGQLGAPKALFDMLKCYFIVDKKK